MSKLDVLITKRDKLLADIEKESQNIKKKKTKVKLLEMDIDKEKNSEIIKTVSELGLSKEEWSLIFKDPDIIKDALTRLKDSSNSMEE